MKSKDSEADKLAALALVASPYPAGLAADRDSLARIHLTGPYFCTLDISGAPSPPSLLRRLRTSPPSGRMSISSCIYPEKCLGIRRWILVLLLILGEDGGEQGVQTNGTDRATTSSTSTTRGSTTTTTTRSCGSTRGTE